MAYITNIKKTVEGNNILINDNDREELISLELKGNTIQDGTPTPTNPVPINVVTGEQEIEVCGRNKFNPNNYKNLYSNGTSVSAIETGLRATVTVAGKGRNYLIYIGKTKDLVGKTIRFKAKFTVSASNEARYYLGYCDDYGSNRTNISSTTTSETTLSITVENGNQENVILAIYSNNNGTGNVGDYVDYTNIMLTIDDADMTYEPYQGQVYKVNLGKNLLPTNTSATETNGITFTVNSDKSITISGTATADAYLYLIGQDNLLTLQPDTYTRYASSDGNNITGIVLQFRKDNVGGAEIFSSAGSGVKTVTLTETTKVVPRIRVLSGTAITTPITIYPMVIKGVYTTYNLPTYAPYKTPIELCEQDYIRKSTGKNLFNFETYSNATSDLNSTISGTNWKCSGTASSTQKYITDYITNTYTSGTYTFSITNTLTKPLILRFYDDNNETIRSASIPANQNSISFTLDGTEKKYRLIFNPTNNTQYNIDINLQLEQGNTATPYEPYGEVWYKYKAIEKIVLNGSETNWQVNGTGTANYFYYRGFTPLMKTGGETALSNYYPYTSVYTSNTNQGFYISATSSSSQIRIRYGAEDTIENFKTSLSTHNTIGYYPLATPKYEIITDTELISQLEAIKLKIGFNRIIVNNNDLSGILKLQYYSQENPYQDTIYSQEDVNSCKLYFNNVELQDADNYLEKITFTKRVLPENGKKIFTLDNFIAEEVEIIIHDIDTSIIKDKVRIELGTLVNNTYEYVPMGVYNIQDIPTRNDNKITIKLRDNACLFDFNYNAKPLIDSLGGSATKMQILQDICSQANVNCNVNSFTGDSDFIGIYDNTIKARMYVAYIAEQTGCIAKIDRYGNLIFIPLNNLYTHRIPLNIVSKYVKGTPFKIERVVYELGTIKFETSNDETLQTLYISSANPYISVQNDIDRIFEIVENFELDSVEIQKEIIGNPAIDGYDLIEIYDDEDITKPVLFKTLANNTLIYNGKFKSKYKTEIGLEERTENVSKNSNETFKKAIKNEIDLVNGKITQTVEEISTLDDTINGLPTYVITTDTIFQADKPYYKLVDNDYVLLVEGTDYQDGDLISSVGYDVYDVIYVDSMMDTVNNNIQGQINDAMQIIQRTLLEQTSEKFTMWFEQTGVKKDLQDLQDLTDENKDNIEIMKAYIDYGTVPLGEPYAGSPYILLGKENSQTKLKILDNRIQFLSSGEETAYISNNTLYINESTVLTKQVIGNNNGRWITDVDSQGNLNTYWGG